MKQIIFVAVFLSLFFIGLSVDARWIPENATPEDIDRLIQMEKEAKERIIKEQKKEEARNATPEGMIKEKGEKEEKENRGENREIPSGVSSGAQQQAVSSEVSSSVQQQAVSSGVSSSVQQQAVHGARGISTSGQKTLVVNQEEGKVAGIGKPIEIKKTGWKDWLVIGLFFSISIGCLIFYFYSMNKINNKMINKHAASKGIILVEILVSTVIVAISILCILKAFQQSSLVQPHAGEATKAITLCQEKLEEIRSMPYESLIGIETITRISMPPYGWNGNTPINGGATRTVIIERIIESGPPMTFVATSSDTFDYLKATVRMEWGTTPFKRELSVFIADRP